MFNLQSINDGIPASFNQYDWDNDHKDKYDANNTAQGKVKYTRMIHPQTNYHGECGLHFIQLTLNLCILIFPSFL